jgi:HAD superfamily hydrolase (TIGR01484 family)
MNRRVIAFDLDGTLAVTKSPIEGVMAARIGDLLSISDVCVISGGKFEQFKVQLIDRLDVTPGQLSKLHIMPTSGTSYFRFDPRSSEWMMQYSENLSAEERAETMNVLTAGSKELGYWESAPDGDIIEDRGSQITFSALGQKALPEKKYAWDPDGVKKEALRDYAAQRLPDLEVHVGGTTSVDVTAAGIDKSYGMRKLMDALGLEREEILFFGDKLDPGGNDYPVKAMGIDTIAVRSWEETTIAIQAIVEVSGISELAGR